MTTQIPEISAEMLLGCLYPELEDRWIAHHDGTFYRNYSRDVMEVDPESGTVWLSRDGFLDLLPQGLLSMEDELRQGDRLEKHKELELQRKRLSEAFLPLDTFAFRRQLRAERTVSALLDDKLTWLLKTYFGFNLASEKNPYVREFAVLLPYVRRWRGDFGLLRNLLSAVFQCRVDFHERRYSQTDSTRQWIPEVRYELLLPDLGANAVQSLYYELEPLKAFLSEWFIPLEVHLDIVIRHHGATPPVDRHLTLDYNTEL